MKTFRLKTFMIGLAMSLILTATFAVSGAGSAFASGGCVLTTSDGCTFAVTGGSLNSTAGTLVAPGNALNGTDQSATIAIPVDVNDSTGSGAGWNITLAMKTVTDGTHSLPASVGIGLIGGCDAGSSCSLPDGTTGSSVTNPATVSITPGSSTLTTASTPTPVVLISSPTNEGMGAMTLTATLTEALLPKSTYAGSYSTTITMVTTSGPA